MLKKKKSHFCNVLTSEGKTHVIHVDSRFYLFFWKEWGLVIVMEETNLFKASNQLNNGFAKLFTVSKPSKHHTL